MCRHTHDVVIYSKFHRNPFRGFGAPGGQNLASPINFGSSLLQQLVLPYKPWSLGHIACTSLFNTHRMLWQTKNVQKTCLYIQSSFWLQFALGCMPALHYWWSLAVMSANICSKHNHYHQPTRLPDSPPVMCTRGLSKIILSCTEPGHRATTSDIYHEQ